MKLGLLFDQVRTDQLPRNSTVYSSSGTTKVSARTNKPTKVALWNHLQFALEESDRSQEVENTFDSDWAAACRQINTLGSETSSLHPFINTALFTPLKYALKSFGVYFEHYTSKKLAIPILLHTIM